MQRYLEVGSVRELIEVLGNEGLRTKQQVWASTGHRGGIPFRRGCLGHLLKNRIYLGDIVHKGVVHPGEHEAIVGQDLWERVQMKLADNGPRLRRIANTKHASLLVGMVFDGLGRRMSPSHANRGSKRYRYYITHAEAGIDDANPAWRVSAHDLERIVVNRLQCFLADGTAVHAAISTTVPDTRQMEIAINAAADAGLELCKSASREQPALLSRYIQRVTLGDSSVEIVVRRASLLSEGIDSIPDSDMLVLHAPTVRVRRGHEVRLIIPSKAIESPLKRDAQLVDLIAEAHAARSVLMASPDTSIDQLAKTQGRCRTHVARLIKLSYLAPDIVTMVLEGRQPPTLSRRKLMTVDLPLRWADQRALLVCN